VLSTLPDVAGLRGVSFAGRRAFVGVVEALGFDDAAGDALAAVLSHESRWNTTARNPQSGAIGILQFMPATARHLGTTPEAIAAMSLVEQLDLVRRFFAPFGKLAARDVPIAPYLPSMVGKPDDTISFEEGSKGYAQNAGLDTDKDGRITLGEVRRDVLRLLDGPATRPRLPIDDEPGAAQPAAVPHTAPSVRGLGLVIAIGIAIAVYSTSRRKKAA